MVNASNWTVTETTGASTPVLTAMSDDGRIQATLEETRDNENYRIRVYESQTYEYDPEADAGGYIDRLGVASVDPSDIGTEPPENFHEAKDFLTEVLEQVEDDEWIADEFESPFKKYLSVDETKAERQLIQLLEKHQPTEIISESNSTLEFLEPSPDRMTELREQAVEEDYIELATLIGSGKLMVRNDVLQRAAKEYRK